MEQFAFRPTLYFGDEPMAALDALAGQRVLIVTDGFLASSGLLGPVTARLTGPVDIFDKVEPDPTLHLVAQGVKALRDFAPDVVVAFGGGSPMDCAKGMCWFSSQRPPLWCIPTTAGTGSEVTSFAVLTDSDRGVKHPLVEEGLLPQCVILDPSLLAGVPPHVTADTGMDVLTHAAEAYVAKGASPFSDAMAEKAFALAFARLPAAYAGDLSAKGDMLLASTMAGIAFNAAGLGLCHAIAHALGGRFHLPHGRLNALLLPGVIAFNAKDARADGRYAHLARLCGLTANSRSLAAALNRLRTALKLPPRLAIPPQELRAALPELAGTALQDVCLEGNPRSATREEITALIQGVGG